MTSLSMGRKTQPTNQPTKPRQTNKQTNKKRPSLPEQFGQTRRAAAMSTLLKLHGVAQHLAADRTLVLPLQRVHEDDLDLGPAGRRHGRRHGRVTADGAHGGRGPPRAVVRHATHAAALRRSHRVGINEFWHRFIMILCVEMTGPEMTV